MREPTSATHGCSNTTRPPLLQDKQTEIEPRACVSTPEGYSSLGAPVTASPGPITGLLAALLRICVVTRLMPDVEFVLRCPRNSDVYAVEGATGNLVMRIVADHILRA